MFRIRKLSDLVGWRLCLGCGACAFICPDDRVRLIDFLAEGIRPVVDLRHCGDCRWCLDVCPAVQTDFQNSDTRSLSGRKDGFTKEWGPIVAMWEGHASDAEVRFKGASGGVLTAIATYCMEKLGMHGVLHVAQDPEQPVFNRTRLSRSRSELVAAAGSRYSPASVCNGLRLVETAPAPCAIIGRPSEIAALQNARKLRAGLDQKVGVTLSFFCAESPATRGTLTLLERLGVDPGSLIDLRYRGHGWPGHFSPLQKSQSESSPKMTYRDSWSFLQRFRPWSVQLWPDGTGELADISCGDPWYIEPDGGNPGCSLVLARSECGRKIIEGAMAAGYLELKPADKWKLKKSQSGLLEKKGAIWGRRMALRLFGLPVTRFRSSDLWHCWLLLPLEVKLRSWLGTVRRILTRKLHLPLKLDDRDSMPVKPPFASIGSKSPVETAVAVPDE